MVHAATKWLEAGPLRCPNRGVTVVDSDGSARSNHLVRMYPIGYNSLVCTTQTTEDFDDWLKRLGDARAKGIIAARIVRLGKGLLGDVKAVGNGVSELRIDYGPGYRVYFTKRGGRVVILLCGGDKKSQPSDIRKAQKMAALI